MRACGVCMIVCVYVCEGYEGVGGRGYAGMRVSCANAADVAAVTRDAHLRHDGHLLPQRFKLDVADILMPDARSYDAGWEY